MSFSAFAQAPNLLNYQGVARNAVGNPLPNQSIKLRLSIHDLLPSGVVVYSEIRPITTNMGGLFSVQIGSAGASSSTGTIAGVNWLLGNKYLQVELDPASNNNFLDIGTAQLVSVPYAFGSGTAVTVKTNANLTGVVTSVGNATSIANGAITSDMIGTLNKSKVGLDLVNNTSDAAKPISTLAQAALDLKTNMSDVASLLESKVDKVVGKNLSTNDYTTAEKEKLADITVNNTGFQDLSLYATNTSVNSSLAGKVDKVTGKDLSSNDFTTTEKNKLATITGTNTGDQINITGNAATATKLATIKNINGIPFDGSTDINISATSDAGTLTGTTLNSTVTSSSLTSVGTLANLTVNNPIVGSITGNSATASTAITAGNITATSNSTLTSLPNLTSVGTISSGTISLTTNINTSGTITAGAVSYPNIHGTSGQVLSTTGSGTLTWTSASSGAHTIGESYGGGIVFYTWDNGLHGLIAATKEIGSEGPQVFSPSSGIKWGAMTSTGAYRFGVGGGFQNTDMIVAKNSNNGTKYFDYNQIQPNPSIVYAALIAQQYSSYTQGNVLNSSFGDWYLPSAGELNLFYANKNSISGTGYISFHSYWSSTEVDVSDAYILKYDGSLIPEIKDYSYYVLPIRKF